MSTFSFQTVKDIQHGFGSIQTLSTWLATQKSQRILIVTDAGLIQQQLHHPLTSVLDQAGYNYTLYSEIQADPPEQLVLSAVAFAKQHHIDTVIGFGGGSSLDVAKIIALMSHPLHTQPLHEMYGINQVQGQRLALALIPTTAGTGSEVTPISILTTGETTKMGIVSPVLYADLVILDAQFSLSLPLLLTAATGIDAMVHAIEAYTSAQKKNPYSDVLAKQALKLLDGALAQILVGSLSPQHMQQARQEMLFGAMLAGQAFANAPVAAVHALAYPLGGRCHLSHGHSNAMVLTEVLRFNRMEAHAEQQYAELMQHLDSQYAITTPKQQSLACDAFIERMQAHLDRSGLPLQLQALSIDKDLLSTLAEDAMLQTRLLQNNPRPLNYQNALDIYQAIYA